MSENRLSEKLGLHARPSPLWQGQLIVLFVTLILAPDFDLGHLFLPRIFIWTLILAPVYIWDTYSGTNFHLGHLFLPWIFIWDTFSCPRFSFGTLILAPIFIWDTYSGPLLLCCCCRHEDLHWSHSSTLIFPTGGQGFTFTFPCRILAKDSFLDFTKNFLIF